MMNLRVVANDSHLIEFPEPFVWSSTFTRATNFCVAPIHVKFCSSYKWAPLIYHWSIELIASSGLNTELSKKYFNDGLYTLYEIKQ